MYDGWMDCRLALSAVRPDLYAKRMLEFVLRHTDYAELMAERQQRLKEHGQQGGAGQKPEKSRWGKIANFLKEKKKDRLDLL